MTIELWKPVLGYEGLYEASNLGRIKSLKKKGRLNDKILLGTLSSYGYPQCRLSKNKKAKTKNIHPLVLEAFVGPCPEGMECRHLDGNPLNNYLENLIWGTHNENMKDKIQHNTSLRGENHNLAKLNQKQVEEIKKMKETHKIIAQKYKVSRSLITQIKNGYIWSYTHAH